MKNERPLIFTGASNGQFNVSFYDEMPNAFLDKPGVKIKWINIVRRLELANEDVIELYELNSILEKSSTLRDEFWVTAGEKLLWKYHKLCQNIAHDLRCACDMLILLTSLAKDDERKIGTIGEYLKKHKEGMQWCFDSFCPYFKELSGFDNSNKHHFTNNLSNSLDFENVGITYIFCIDLWKYEKADQRSVSMVEIINLFNDFYLAVINEIKKV